MAYNREEAARRAFQSKFNVPGTCQKWTRTIFGATSVGDFDKDGDADAVDGWKHSTHKHPGDRNPPRGVPVSWSGGRKGYGHRAISLGNGLIRSTDAPRIGRVGTVKLDWFEKNWGLTYLGWSEDISGVVIPLPKKPIQTPRLILPKEKTMDRFAIIKQLRAAGVECHSRAEWYSKRQEAYIKRRETHPMPAGPAPYHFLHLTVTKDTDSVKEGMTGAQQIEGYGYSTPPMVSYQDLITNEGRYFQGQDYGNKGTHTVNDKNVNGFPKDLNRQGYALALMQNEQDAVTDIQVRVAAMVFAARELSGWVKKGAPVYPHRKFSSKRCPGDKAVARLPEIIKLKNYYVKHGLPKKGLPDVNSRITVIAWNVWVGHKAAHVVEELRTIIKNQNPDVIVLFEAKNLFDKLHGLGYEVDQLNPKPLVKGNQPGAGNVAVLVKRGLKKEASVPLWMKQFWIGPVRKNKQDPRVYHWVLVKKGRRTWKIGGFHFPFGTPSRNESITAVKNWFSSTVGGRPTIAVGDYNMGSKGVADQIGTPSGAKVVGQGIDLAAFKNCRSVRAQSLGNHGSDHPAMKYVFEA